MELPLTIDNGTTPAIAAATINTITNSTARMIGRLPRATIAA